MHFLGFPTFLDTVQAVSELKCFLKAVSEVVATLQCLRCSIYGVIWQKCAEKCQLAKLKTLPSKDFH